jgi:hypothetical protein
VTPPEPAPTGAPCYCGSLAAGLGGGCPSHPKAEPAPTTPDRARLAGIRRTIGDLQRQHFAAHGLKASGWTTVAMDDYYADLGSALDAITALEAALRAAEAGREHYRAALEQLARATIPSSTRVYGNATRLVSQAAVDRAEAALGAGAAAAGEGSDG